MALWTFHNNPGIGGFGETNQLLLDGDRKRSESHVRKKQSKEASCSFSLEAQMPLGTRSFIDDHNNIETANVAMNKYSVGGGDLLCQIVKELVDNAVDACRRNTSQIGNSQNSNSKANLLNKIRVDIRPITGNGRFANISIPEYPSKEYYDDILQVTVTDTGCGMENIHKCVNAFHRNKKGRQISKAYSHTSGRYGIGLTLCLLHAQRCIPNSRACISSATPKSKFRTRAFFKVDKEADAVICVEEETINISSFEQQSGTSVSLLVPVSSRIVIPFDYFRTL